MVMLDVVVGILDREEEGCILGTQTWGLCTLWGLMGMERFHDSRKRRLLENIFDFEVVGLERGWGGWLEGLN